MSATSQAVAEAASAPRACGFGSALHLGRERGDVLVRLSPGPPPSATEAGSAGQDDENYGSRTLNFYRPQCRVSGHDLRIVMKPRHELFRLKSFEVDEYRRKVAGIDAMIHEFNQMVGDLDHQITVEQERSGVSDVNHYAYPTFAKAAIQRRDNLRTSIAELEAKLAATQEQLSDALEELKKFERDADRRSDQASLDQVVANIHLRVS
jgi:flagellar FliJ protein